MDSDTLDASRFSYANAANVPYGVSRERFDRQSSHDARSEPSTSTSPQSDQEKGRARPSPLSYLLHFVHEYLRV
jgi:hypothetical protein